jgi:restriction system protein
MTAWLIRGGSQGEREAWAIENRVSGGGFKEVGDLTTCASRDDVLTQVDLAMPGNKNRNKNFAAQLWALRGRIVVGDIIVMPLHPSTHVAIGRCVGGYRFQADESPGKQHVIGVDWIRPDVPRVDFKQDLLYMLGAFMTTCRIYRNDAETRLEKLLAGGIDPGATLPPMPTPTPSKQTDDETDPEPENVDIEAVARDRIRIRMKEAFSGHLLSDLTAAVLRARGLQCVVSPPGPDKGIDIVAGAGPLGLDSPRILVQCKSQDSAVDVQVVLQLQGAMSTTGADQALLVAYGGLTKAARNLLTNQQFNLKVWETEDLLDAFLETYDTIDDSIREILPIKKMWTLIDQEQ